MSMHIGVIAVLTVLSTPLDVAATAPPPAGVSIRLVYRCEHGGVMTFSDRPCSERSQTYEPDISRVSIYEGKAVERSGRGQSQARPQRAIRSNRGSIAADQAKHKAACAKLADTLREVRGKMRSGYNAKEGEKLQARKAKLTERARQERCR